MMVGVDSTLVDEFLGGDPMAAETISKWIGLAAWSFRSRFGDDWEDAVADATLQVTRALREGRFAGRGTLKAYVRRVALTTCLDRLRSKKRWRWTELVEELHPEDPKSPADRVESEDTWRLAAMVVKEMSDDCVRLWRMLLDGLDYAQMAERLDTAAGTLRVRVLRCRKRAVEIRRKLECNNKATRTPE